MFEHVGIQGQNGGDHIEWVIPCAVPEAVKMGKHQFVALHEVRHFPSTCMKEVEHAFHRVAHPVLTGSQSDKGTVTPIE